MGLSGFPYQMTTYRDCDLACVYTSFGGQIHHPQFLECVGATESAWLLGHPPVEWSQVMDRRDAMIAVLKLQQDARLMTSNLTILNQYVMALHRMSLEVLQSVLGHDEFPTRAVEDAAPVPRVHRASIHMAAMGQTVCGVPRAVREVPGRLPCTMMGTAQVVLDVRRGRPVSSSDWTAG